MKDQLRADLERLEGLAFGKVSGRARFLERFHSMASATEANAGRAFLDKIYGCGFVPLSLWPEDLRGFGIHLIDSMDAGRELDAAARMMARLLPEAPGEDV